jgi:hypothetical protein
MHWTYFYMVMAKDLLAKVVSGISCLLVSEG